MVDDILARLRATGARVFGIGPVPRVPAHRDRVHVPRHRHRASIMQVAVAQAGPGADRADPAALRPAQRLPRARRRRDSGFHQLCTITSDYAGEEGALRGSSATSSCREMFVRGQHVGFVDTLDDFGFYTELAEDVPGFVEGLTRVARTCAEWDGYRPRPHPHPRRLPHALGRSQRPPHRRCRRRARRADRTRRAAPCSRRHLAAVSRRRSRVHTSDGSRGLKRRVMATTKQKEAARKNLKKARATQSKRVKARRCRSSPRA